MCEYDKHNVSTLPQFTNKLSKCGMVKKPWMSHAEWRCFKRAVIFKWRRILRAAFLDIDVAIKVRKLSHICGACSLNVGSQLTVQKRSTDKSCNSIEGCIRNDGTVQLVTRLSHNLGNCVFSSLEHWLKAGSLSCGPMARIHAHRGTVRRRLGAGRLATR